MTEHMKIWSEVEKTDPSFTKPFSRGGGFKGTATNATYLARKATEVFGPCGIGWGVEVVDEELMKGAPLAFGPDGMPVAFDVIHKVRVKLWYLLDGQRGEVVQFGQTTFVGKNKNGFFTDEEAPKKSLTDGMSKCLSLLGFAADIHLGRYDDNKYVSDLAQEFEQKNEAQKRASSPKIDQDQGVELDKLVAETDTDLAKFLKFFKVEALGDLPASEFDKAKRMLTKKKAQPKEEPAE